VAEKAKPMDKSTKYTKKVQDGVTLTIEVEGANTDARVMDNTGRPEDLIEVFNTKSGATSRIELQQNDNAEAEM
jgi:hypothetical protein